LAAEISPQAQLGQRLICKMSHISNVKASEGKQMHFSPLVACCQQFSEIAVVYEQTREDNTARIFIYLHVLL